MIKCDDKQKHIIKSAFIILMIAALMIVPPSPPAEALITEGAAVSIFVVLIGLVASAAGLKIVYDNIQSGGAESYWGDKYSEWQNSLVLSGGQSAVEPIDIAISNWLNISALLPYPDASGMQKIILGASAFGAIKDFLQWLTVSQGATDGTSVDFTDTNLYGDSMTYIGDIPVMLLPQYFRSSTGGYFVTYAQGWQDVYVTIGSGVNSDQFIFFSRNSKSGSLLAVTSYRYNNDGSNAGTGGGIQSEVTYPRKDGNIYYVGARGSVADIFPDGYLGLADWTKLKSIYSTSEIVSKLNELLSGDEYEVVDVGSSIEIVGSEGVDQLRYPSLEGADSIGLDTTIPWTGADSLEDVLVGSLSEVLENAATAEYAESQTLDVPATDIPAFDGSYPLTTPSLTTKFPFSIPFDIFRMASAFKSDPVTPVIDYDMDFGITVYHWHLDFSIFDGTAALLRRLELIGFVGALAYATKYLIHW